MQKKEKRKRNCNQKHFYLDWNHTWQKSQKTGHPVSATGRHSLLPRPEERNFQWEPERSSGLFHQERRGGGGGCDTKGRDTKLSQRGRQHIKTVHPQGLPNKKGIHFNNQFLGRYSMTLGESGTGNLWRQTGKGRQEASSILCRIMAG